MEDGGWKMGEGARDEGRGARGEVRIAVRPLLRGLTGRGMRRKRRRGDGETRRQGDKEMGRGGERGARDEGRGARDVGRESPVAELVEALAYNPGTKIRNSKSINTYKFLVSHLKTYTYTKAWHYWQLVNAFAGDAIHIKNIVAVVNIGHTGSGFKLGVLAEFELMAYT